MPLKIFRRRGKQPNVRAKRTSTPRAFSRRVFLKGAAAVAGASIIGCRTAPLTDEQLAELKIRDIVRALPPITTSLRTGNSVKQAIENIPNVRMLEINFQKYKTGEMRNASTKRSFDWSRTLPVDPKVRSTIHTHPTFDTKSPLEKKMSQCPSAIDLLNLITKYYRKKPAKKLQYSHIAVVSAEGKVMGYYSMMIGKKLEKTLLGRSIFPSAEKKQLIKEMDKLRYIERLNRNQAPYSAFLRLERVIKTLQEMGLRIRKTPMPGHIYKDGYFQPK